MDFQALLAQAQKRLAELRGSFATPVPPKPAPLMTMAPKAFLQKPPQMSVAPKPLLRPQPVENTFKGIARNTILGIPDTIKQASTGLLKAGSSMFPGVERAIQSVKTGSLKPYTEGLKESYGFLGKPLLEKDANTGKMVIRPETVESKGMFVAGFAGGGDMGKKVSGLLPTRRITPKHVRAANEDWALHYADREASLSSQASELQSALKTAKATERPALATRLSEVNKQSAQMQDEFLKKWDAPTQKAPVQGAPSSPIARPVSEVDRLIAEGKIRVVRRGEYDVYQTKKGGQWVNARDESSAVKKVTQTPLLKPKTEAPHVEAIKQRIEEDRIMLGIQEDVLSSHPGAELKKFVKRQKGAEFEGKLPEVNRFSKSGQLKRNGHHYKDTRTRWEKEGDSIYDEVLNNHEGSFGTRKEHLNEAQDLLDDFMTQRQSLDELKDQLKQRRVELAEARKVQKQGLLKTKQVQSSQGQTVPTKPLLQKSESGTASPLLPNESRGQTLPAQKVPAPKQVPEVEARSLEPLAPPTAKVPNIGGAGKIPSLEETIQQTPVKNKVNILDYVRTPDRVLKKIGLEKEAIELRRAHDSYIKELPKNLDKVTEWSKRAGKGSSGRIFRYLDGEAIELAPREKEVAMEIKGWLSEWADRLGLPKDKRIANYITHLFDDQLIAKEFDEDLAKIIANKIPGAVYDPFLEKRLGAKGYKQDVWGALDAYVKRATRKVHMDPALESVELRAGGLEESQWNYVKKYVDNVNMRPTGLDTLLDNFIKSTPLGYKLGQRPTSTASKAMRQIAYRAMLGLNPGSAVRNLSQGVNVYAKLGEKHTALGYVKLFSPSSRAELVREGVLENGFIQDRALSATKKAIEKMDKALFVFFDTAEKINRGAAYLGAKSKALSKGMKEAEAVEFAKKIVRQTQFNYDALDTSVFMQPDLVKTGLQFFTYPIKQSEFLAEMVANKEWAGLARYAGAGLVFVYTIGQAIGMKPEEILPTFRFGVPPSLQTGGELISAGLDLPDEYGNKRTAKEKLEDVGKSALTTLVPAGTQIRKSWMGTEAVLKGGSYDKSGRQQYPVGGGLLKDAQAIAFGKSATHGAQQYYKDREKPKEKTKLDEAAEKRTLYRAQKIRPIYDEVQKLVASGKEEDARRIVDSLSDADYEEYKTVKSAEKRKATLAGQDKMIPVYENVQALVAQGKQDEALAIVNALSDEEYEWYQSVKEKLK